MLTQSQCNNLRDHIYNNYIDYEHGSIAMFSLLAVIPGGICSVDASVHYAYSEEIWKQSGFPDSPVKAINYSIQVSPFADKKINIIYHNCSLDHWPIDWGITSGVDLYNNQRLSFGV